MGANQSNTGGQHEHVEQIQTSYYELLGVERQATDEEYIFSLFKLPGHVLTAV